MISIPPRRDGRLSATSAVVIEAEAQHGERARFNLHQVTRMSNQTYREHLYRSYSRTFGQLKSAAEQSQWRQYESIYRQLPKNRAARIIDLGCGKGEWVRWMRSKGYVDVTGVDVSVEDLAIAGDRGGGTFVRDDALRFLAGLAAASVDLIHLKDVAEHWTRDELLRAFANAHRALRTDGELWVLTFNAQSPLSSATRYGDLTHELGLTPSSFVQALRAGGFERISISGYHCSARSLRGASRRLLGALVFGIAGIVLRTRHGSGRPIGGVDIHTALPDLFAIARR